MNLTLADVEAHNAKVFAARFKIKPSDNPHEGKESELHNLILAECRKRRFYVVHSRTDRRTTTEAGVPDFIIGLPDGKTLWVEVKNRTGKLSAEQNVARHVLLAMGHHYALVRSFDEFVSSLESF